MNSLLPQLLPKMQARAPFLDAGSVVLSPTECQIFRTLCYLCLFLVAVLVYIYILSSAFFFWVVVLAADGTKSQLLGRFSSLGSWVLHGATLRRIRTSNLIDESGETVLRVILKYNIR